ncbi:MAG: gamma-glutamylcyclotransferase family protein [Bryobacteraceae bacterium]
MEARRINVFFYGLFMDAELLLSKGAYPRDARIACVPGFALRIGQRATLVPNAASTVYGIVMDLSHAHIELLYSETGVNAYRPEAVLAQVADGSYIAAICFNLVVPPAIEEADSEYAMKLRQLAGRLKLPSAYVDGIR